MPIVTSGLTSHWDFKDGTGTTITDQVGSSDGTLVGTATNFWDRTDRDGDAVGQFNGSDNRVSAGVSFPAGDFSLVAAVWVGEFFERRTIASDREAQGESVRGWQLRADDADGIRFLILGSSVHSLSLDIRGARHFWMVVQVTFNSSTGAFSLRVNENHQDGASAEILAPVGPGFQIGWWDDPTQTPWFLGRTADVLWYDGKVLSSAEQDDNFEAIMERLRGTVSVSTPDASVTKAAIALPSDGVSTRSGRSASSSQLWTTTDKVLVADAEDEGGGNVRNRIWRYSKTAGEMASSIDSGQEGTPYAARTADDTHLALGIGVDPAGRIQIGEHRVEDWRVLRSDSGLDVTAFSAVTDTTAHTASLSYTYFFTDGTDLYLRIQDRAGSGNDGVRWWKWDTGTSAWVDLASEGPRLFRHTDGGAGKVYGTWLAVDGTTIWATGSINTNAGADRETGPFVLGGIIRSTDDGTTWHEPSTGTTVSLAATRATVDVVIPNSRELTGTDAWEGDQSGLTMTLDGNGAAHFAVPWANNLEGDTKLSLWYARWDSTGSYFTQHRLLAHGAEDVGVPRIGIIGSTLFIVAPAQSRDAASPDRIVYLFTSTDGGDTWTRDILDTQVGNYISEGNLDERALVVDSKVRYLPLYWDQETKAEVWEFSLPAGGGEAGAGNMSLLGVG